MDYYLVSPNPSPNNVTFSVIQNNPQAAQKTFSEVKIYDQHGSIKKITKYNKVKSATIAFLELTNGTYWIEISGDNYSERKILVIQR